VSLFHKGNFAVFQVVEKETKRVDNLANADGVHEGPDGNTDETETFSGFAVYPKLQGFTSLCTGKGSTRLYSADGRESSSSGSEREETVECVHYDGELADSVVQTRGQSSEERRSRTVYGEQGRESQTDPEETRSENASAVVYLLDWKKTKGGAQMLARVSVVNPGLGELHTYVARE
jgi:hypothetical protein